MDWKVKLIPNNKPASDGRFVIINRAERPDFGSDPLGTSEHVVAVERVHPIEARRDRHGEELPKEVT